MIILVVHTQPQDAHACDLEQSAGFLFTPPSLLLPLERSKCVKRLRLDGQTEYSPNNGESWFQ